MQGSRIVFTRRFRMLSQDDVSETRYEKGNRNLKDKRLNEIADILSMNVNSIKNIIMLIIRLLLYVTLGVISLISLFRTTLYIKKRLN